MQEAEEQDTCRICSAPAEPEQPLFYPCKCSGTIRYIHQDCLTTWLAHSKKKNCDVCKHPYSFTKVYATDMPSRLPPVLLLRRVAQQAFFALLFALRGVAVAAIWLAVLPWATVMTWRMYFAMGDSTAWWISDTPRPTESPQYHSPFHMFFYAESTAVPPPDTLVGRVAAHPLWQSLSADIFTGQIIASLVVLTFVAVFLLREWISQNARPGVFEDDEQQQQQQEQPMPAAPEPAPAPVLLRPPPREEDRLAGALAADARRLRAEARGIPAAEARRLRAEARGLPAPRLRPAKPLKHIRRDFNGNHHPDDATAVDKDEFRPTSRARRKPPRHDGGRRSLSEPRDSKPTAPQLNAAAAAVQDPAARLLAQREEARRERERGKWRQYRQTELPDDMPVDGGQQPAPRPNLPSIDPTTMSLPSSPRASPTLATYRAPEELESSVASASAEAGPSRPYAPLESRKPDPTVDAKGKGKAKEEDTGVFEMDSDWDASDIEHYFSEVLANVEIDDEMPPLEPVPGFEDQFIDDKMPPLEPVPGFEDQFIDDEMPPLEPVPGFEDQFNVEDDMPRLEAVSDSDEEESKRPNAVDAWTDRATPSPGRTPSPTARMPSPPAAVVVHPPTPPPAQDDLDDDDEFDEDDDEEVEEVDPPPQVQYNPDAPVWQAIQIEDDEVAEVGDGEMEMAQPEPEAPPPGDAGVDPPDLNDDFDGNVEDDMDGAMEAIGMRGPILGVLQNAGLMIFVLDMAIGLLVWLPFTLGKTTALLSLNPQRLLKIIHLPIRAIRILTDPIVDSIMYIVASLLFPFVAKLLYRLVNVLFIMALFVTSLVVGQEAVDKALEATNNAVEPVLQFLDKPFEHIMSWNVRVAEAPAPAPPPPTPSAPSVLSQYQTVIIETAEPYFAALGKEVRVNAVHVGEGWMRLALGHGPKERVFAVCLGYLVVIFMVAIYLNLLTVGNMKTAGRAVRSAVREQLLVVKVAAFIFIELVIFPLGCGIVLDLCTVFLFPEANFASRVEYFKFAPFTAMFYHWVAGTMFMYSFAVLLAGCRALLRRGAMWFIKDPQDQNSHPIRDILDRPTLTQLRKIFISGIMYSVVVACVVGSVASLLYLGQKSILPFRWKNREPLSDVPVDLIFLHLTLPYTMQYLRPRAVIKRTSKTLWKFLAQRLRLSSYFFGGRHPEEEYTPKTWAAALFKIGDDVDNPSNVQDGTFRRVPASDNISLPREMRATAAVTETGEPVDDEARKLIDQQNTEAIKARRDPAEDYMVVYLPPGFRYRVCIFVAVLWIIGAIFLGVVFGLPIQLGRGFFALFMKSEVHDGYSFIVGAYLLWACYLIGRAVDRLDKRRQRRGGDEPRADLGLLVVKRGLLWLAKVSYMGLFLGVVIPTLIALVVDLYIVLPIRLSLDPTLVPRVRIVDSWAMGLLYSKIMLHVMLAQPLNDITRGIQHIINGGWTHPEPVAATKEVIGPLTIGLLGMIFLPGGAFVVAQRYLPLSLRNNKMLFMEVYPTIFALAASARFGAVAMDMLGTWSQAIRDKEFLVEMRLRNLEPEPQPKMEEEEELELELQGEVDEMDEI
ncbi:RING-CH-type domain-containing protein [Mycena chlorophos]|uniref:RING-type E3 ubiquitin transferase n=1 Tax=Mycena chlorophos TaxID=658473 RepID=A0A8H6VRA3_MYCCL|nr:RING-CH-type domain-containing protein [Mycena chlorophos]